MPMAADEFMKVVEELDDAVRHLEEVTNMAEELAGAAMPSWLVVVRSHVNRCRACSVRVEEVARHRGHP